MTQAKLIVRALRPDDISQLVELCESRVGFDRAKAESRAALVKWLAFSNPASDGEPTYFVGDIGGQLVSHLGRMPTKFVIDGAVESGSYIHDLYVHPDIRAKMGQGFFLTSNMYQAAENASPGFCALIWSNEINIAIQQARHYTESWTDRYHKLLGFDHVINRLLPSTIATIANSTMRFMLHGIDRILAIGRRKHYRIERLDYFDSRFDEFEVNERPTIGIAPQKNSAYLNWKYIQRPNIEAVPYVAYDSKSELVGYVVVVRKDSAYQGTFIAELVAAKNEEQLIRELIDEATTRARRAGVERMCAVATAVPYAKSLKSRLFFSRAPREPLFLAQEKRSPNSALLTEPKNWHMSFGDSEGPI